jgi:ornithine cyclodeaminase/alanine dehydrogenase-like protein (mu-crystallin family)
LTLLLNNDDVSAVLTMRMAMEALEDAYQQLFRKDAVCRPRIDIRIPNGDGDHTSVGGRPDEPTFEKVDIYLRLGTAPGPMGLPAWATPNEWVAYAAQPDNPVWSQHAMASREVPPLKQLQLKGRQVMLEDLLAGRDPGRTSSQEITYSERGNLQGNQFWAVAGKVYEAARARGVGRELPTEWFLQDIRD